jgi:hypothetical protein
MPTLLVSLGIIWFVVRALAKRRGKPSAARARPTTRHEAIGEAGEARVQDELRRVLTSLCGNDFYLHPTAVLLHHAPGSAFPTAEVDHLVVTPFGLFVVETKNWSGSIQPGPTPNTLVRVAPDGSFEPRRSPDSQNRTKVAFLRGMLPGMWPVEGLGVFASASCDLSPRLPLSLIRIDELAHCLRARKARFESAGQRPVNVAVARDAVLSVAVTEPSAIDQHRNQVRMSRIFSEKPKVTVILAD